MFFSNNTALYSAERRARCLAARTAHTDAHHFFLGTLSLREANEVQMLQFDEDTSELSKARSFAHPHEVWCIAASPADENLLATTYSDGGSFGAALWRLPASEGEGGSGSAEEMEQLQTLPCSPAENGRGNVRSVMWDPFTADEDDAQIAAVHERGVVVWKVGESDAPHAQLRLGEEAPIGAAAWDPHHPNELTVASGCAINSYDLRAVRRAVKKGAATDATVHSIANAHSAPVKDVDYNPNKPWNIVSAGDDSFIKFWDLRKASAPIKVLDGHSHWVTQAKFNLSHDQLVASASTDSHVSLWRISSISSAPLLELEDETSAQDAQDALIKTYDEHEDSVYSVAWSACDPWIFASLSYDGRVAVRNVPSEDKYRILL